MTRVAGWHSAYVAFIDQMRREPFVWGSADCGPAWAGQVIEIITGQPNPVKDHIGTYDSIAGAIRAMKRAGFNDLKEAAASFLGEPSHPSLGTVGDIACIAHDSPLGFSLGIVNGERVFFRLPDGIGTMDLLSVDSVFKL